MHWNRAPGVAVPLAVIAVSAVALLFLDRDRESPRRDPSEGSTAEELDALTRKIDALASTLDARERPSRDGAAELDRPEREALRLEIEALKAELRLRELGESDDARARPELDRALRIDRTPLSWDEVVGLQSAVQDRARSPGERVDALRQLRRTREGRTAEVVASALEILESTPEASLRAAICRNLKGAVPVELMDPLLRALQSDVSPTVREEAAEALSGPLADVPVVRHALEQAAENDTSEDVRIQAAASLDG